MLLQLDGGQVSHRQTLKKIQRQFKDKIHSKFDKVFGTCADENKEQPKELMKSIGMTSQKFEGILNETVDDEELLQIDSEEGVSLEDMHRYTVEL